MKSKTIEEAESLCATNSHENINKAIGIYKILCLSKALDPFAKRDTVVSFLKNVPDEGREMLIKWRDLTPFIRGKELADHKKLLLLIAQTSDVEIHERSITAVYLYNMVYFDICYQAFESIALDESVDYKYRVDACRFLFGSEMEENKEIAQECLIDIVSNMKISSEDRYTVIAGFISKTGVSTYLNQSKIKVPYDEEFLYAIQLLFFECEENGVRERILSGQHILKMGCATLEEKEGVSKVLLGIAANEEYEENIRADAADVMLRMGTIEHIKTAKKIIKSLGDSDTKESVRTIYTNSQNMHDEKIAESVEKYITKLVEEEAKREDIPYEKVQTAVLELVKNNRLENKDKFTAKRALHRVSVDTAEFTEYKVTLARIFVLVWSKIERQTDKVIKALLQERLIEELVEMGDTCSSGHSGRFVNVLSPIDPTISISFDSQIAANISGRLNALIRNIEDTSKREDVISGMMDESPEDGEDRNVYNNFIKEALVEIKKELYSEFVEERYIGSEEFEQYFENAAGKWVK